MSETPARTYASITDIRNRTVDDGLKRTEITIPELSDDPILFCQLRGAGFALVEDDFTALGTATNKAKADFDVRKRNAARDGLPFDETEPDTMAHWKGDKIHFFVNMILACAEQPSFDPETDRDMLLNLPFDRIFEVGGKLLEFIGGEATQEEVAKRQARFQGDGDGAEGPSEVPAPAE